jgi:nucleotide-binding universal stress UspA family protein
MVEKILVPVDFSGGSRSALNAVKEILGVREIVLLHVVYNRYPSANPAIVHPRVQEARAALEEIKKGLVIPGAMITTLVEEITGGEISEVINRTAIRLGISLVVMGRRGTGIIESLLLGSVASDTLRYGKTDLLLIPSLPGYGQGNQDPGKPFQRLFSHVLVCTDFSEPEIACICLDELPWIPKVTLFHAVTTGDSPEEVRSSVEASQAGLERLQKAFTRISIPVQTHVSVGSAAEDIISFSEKEDISIIVLKSTGKRGFLLNLIGSTTARVARDSKKPVLVLRRSPAAKQ